MEQPATPDATPRHDGWTPERKTHFLDALAHDGNVRAACARVGMSREAAYRLRRRDALMARCWSAALMLAGERTAEVLGDRAIEGIEEQVWYRGEVVGTRRRYDNRLLLAHMARLDRLAETGEAVRTDAARFDELVALAAGLEPPEELVNLEDDLPASREVCAERAGKAADRELREAAEEAERAREAEDAAWLGVDEQDEEEAAYERFLDQRVAAYRQARDAAGERWDGWQAEARAAIDRMLAQPARDIPVVPAEVIASLAATVRWTPSTLSTLRGSTALGGTVPLPARA